MNSIRAFIQGRRNNFCSAALTINLSLPVGTTYLPAGTFTLPLSATEALQADCDIKATNIILQGLPPEVYALGRQTSIAAGTSRTYTPRASGNYSGKQRTLSATTAKGKATCPNSAPNQRGKGMIRGLRIKFDALDAYDVIVMNCNTAKTIHSLEQSNVVNHSETEITSDINIIPYSQYLIESQQVAVQNSNYSTQQDDLILSDNMMQEKIKQIDSRRIDYAALNKLYKDFETRFVPQTELSAEQAFWSHNSMSSSEPDLSDRPTNVEVPKELPKVSMVNTSLKKLKYHLANFDVEKVLVITTLKDELRKLKGKDLANNEKHTQEEAAVLRDLVDHIKANYPLDPTLESACKYTKLIQELLSKISKTCPSINNSGEQLVVVTPMNKVKRVRFTEPVTSSRNTITKKASTSNLASNKPMLSSTGVKPSTSASGSQPSGNTKKDKILQTQSSTQMNKVEAYPRKNNNVNARAKFKSAKKQTKRKVWKPTRKMFTTIGYIWRPTGQTFTIVGNVCPLTRITTTTEAPLRKPVVLDNETSKPAVTLVYSRKPRNSKTNVPVKQVLRRRTTDKFEMIIVAKRCLRYGDYHDWEMLRYQGLLCGRTGHNYSPLVSFGDEP
ncbi:hypothetical protein Tco_0257140 [Tanacetum coccineum]